MNIRAKILNRILEHRIQQYIKKFKHHDQVNLSKECKDGSITANKLTWITNVMKNKNLVITIETDKSFDKIQKPLEIKALNKVDIEEIYLNIKVHTWQHIANILFNGDKLQAFPLRLIMSKRFSLSFLSFKIVLKVLFRTIRQEK